MENEEDAATAATDPKRAGPAFGCNVARGPTEKRIRRLTGRSAAYRGQIVGITRGWVSRG